MNLDPEKPVVQWCIRGMEMEAVDLGQAKSCFRQAWDHAASSFEKCIAAHYLARHPDDPADELHWNLTALGYAQEAPPESVAEFFPSLYLNAANAYRKMGDREAAVSLYEKALRSCASVSPDSYQAMIRAGIEKGWKEALAME